MTSIEPMNVIYIVLHDLGKQLGCYGAEVESPYLDRFAEEGIKFSHMFCSSVACSPSRGCAMTGMYAHTNGLMGLVNQGWSMPENVKTIVDYLNESDYETVQFGLQHERYSPSVNRYQKFSSFKVPVVEDVMQDAVSYLEARQKNDAPFYMNIGLWEVHTTSWQSVTSPQRVKVYGPTPIEDVYMPPFLPDFPPLRREFANFQSCIRYTDSQLQRLFETIHNLGFDQNTLVILTTDHGIGGKRAKGTLYDAGTEITCLMQLPKCLQLKQGVEFGDLAQNIDYVPTILDMLDLPIPDQVQGKSQWRRLIGETKQPVHDEIFLERNHHGAYDPIRAVRTKKYKYIRNFADDPIKEPYPHEVTHMNDSYKVWSAELWPEYSEPRSREELFDISQDPYELKDLANEPQYEAVLQKMREKLDRWMVDTDDPLLQGPIPNKLNGWPLK